MEEIQIEIDKLEFARDYYSEDYVFESNIKKLNTLSLIDDKIKELKEKLNNIKKDKDNIDKGVQDKNNFINEIQEIGMKV